MATNRISRGFTLGSVAAVFLLLTGCPGPYCPDAAYQFAITVALTPDVDSVRVGDTLRVRASFPSQLRDLRSGQMVDYSNATLISSTLFIDNITAGTFINAGGVKDFAFVNKVGNVYTDQNLTSQDRVKQVDYKAVGNRYELDAAIIPVKKGIYSIAFSNGGSKSRQGSKTCEQAEFEVSVLSSKRNYAYLQAAYGRPATRRDSLQNYCVKVY